MKNKEILKRIELDPELNGIYEAELGNQMRQNIDALKDKSQLTGWMTQGHYQHEFTSAGFTGQTRPITLFYFK